MTKTNYSKPSLLENPKDFIKSLQKVFEKDQSLHLDYVKLLSDMKEFNRDSSLIFQTLLSINENEKIHSSEDVDKVFNLIPNNHSDAWEQLNKQQFTSNSSDINSSKLSKNPLRKKFFLANSQDGKNTDLHSVAVDHNHEYARDIVINVSHNIKADNPEKVEDFNTSKELLSKYLSKKPIKFSNFSGNKIIEYEFIYPSLHPKVITCISFIKRAVSIFFKCHGMNFSSIDIVPVSNNNYQIFVASSEAADINSYCSKNSILAFSAYRSSDEVECSPLANQFNLFLDEIFSESKLYNCLQFKQSFWMYLTFNIYSRDKSLRFEKIMNERIERIIKTIRSLNNLHHKGNYEFVKSDFDNSYERLDKEIKDYKTTYEQWFKDNFIPKSPEEEIEMLKRQLAEKEELLRKSKK